MRQKHPQPGNEWISWDQEESVSRIAWILTIPFVLPAALFMILCFLGP